MVKKRGKMQCIHLDNVKLGSWLSSDTLCNVASNAHLIQNVICTTLHFLLNKFAVAR